MKKLMFFMLGAVIMLSACSKSNEGQSPEPSPFDISANGKATVSDGIWQRYDGKEYVNIPFPEGATIRFKDEDGGNLIVGTYQSGKASIDLSLIEPYLNEVTFEQMFPVDDITISNPTAKLKEMRYPLAVYDAYDNEMNDLFIANIDGTNSTWMSAFIYATAAVDVTGTADTEESTTIMDLHLVAGWNVLLVNSIKSSRTAIFTTTIPKTEKLYWVASGKNK